MSKYKEYFDDMLEHYEHETIFVDRLILVIKGYMYEKKEFTSIFDFLENHNIVVTDKIYPSFIVELYRINYVYGDDHYLNDYIVSYTIKNNINILTRGMFYQVIRSQLLFLKIMNAYSENKIKIEIYIVVIRMMFNSDYKIFWKNICLTLTNDNFVFNSESLSYLMIKLIIFDEELFKQMLVKHFSVLDKNIHDIISSISRIITIDMFQYIIDLNYDVHSNTSYLHNIFINCRTDLLIFCLDNNINVNEYVKYIRHIEYFNVLVEYKLFTLCELAKIYIEHNKYTNLDCRILQYFSKNNCDINDILLSINF